MKPGWRGTSSFVAALPVPLNVIVDPRLLLGGLVVAGGR